MGTDNELAAYVDIQGIHERLVMADIKSRVCEECGVDMGVNIDEHVCDAASYGPLDYVANMIYQHAIGPDAKRWWTLRKIVKDGYRDDARRLVANWVTEEMKAKFGNIRER